MTMTRTCEIKDGGTAGAGDCGMSFQGRGMKACHGWLPIRAPPRRTSRGRARKAGSKEPSNTVGLSTRLATSSSSSPWLPSGTTPGVQGAQRGVGCNVPQMWDWWLLGAPGALHGELLTALLARLPARRHRRQRLLRLRSSSPVPLCRAPHRPRCAPPPRRPARWPPSAPPGSA